MGLLQISGVLNKLYVSSKVKYLQLYLLEFMLDLFGTELALKH